MVRAWKFFWVSIWALFIGFVFTRNVIKYKDKKWSWKIGKSFMDTIVIALSAIFLPPFLIAMNAAWVGSFFTNRWLKMTVGLTVGIFLGLISTYAMELIILMGVFSVDLKTGTGSGILKRWQDVKTEEKTGVPIAA